MKWQPHPSRGQSLEEARDLLLAQIEHLKNGNFDDWLIDAVINNFKLTETRYAESNWFRTSRMTNAFILEQDWEKVVKTNDRLSLMKKEDVVKFAQENFNDNYAIVYKRNGVDTNKYKVDKPTITPIEINRDTSSKFAQYFDSLPEDRMTPIFLDFDKDIHQEEFRPGIKYYSIENKSNNLFSLFYVLDMGKNHDQEMALAVEYLKYLGTQDLSADDLSKEFFKLGVDYKVFTSSDRVYVYLSGIQESFEPAIELFEKLLASPKEDPEALSKLVDNILKKRADNKLDQYYIHQSAMMNYGKYGPNNPLKNSISESELRAVEPGLLIQKIKELTSYEHLVFFYGSIPDEKVLEVLNNSHSTPEVLLAYPEEKIYPELENEENLVYFVHYDMVQTELMMLSKGGPFNKDILPYSNIFNEYFGGGLSSIVFQEIRESKALAYAAYAWYSSPRRTDRSHYLQTYMATQTNKLGEATEAILELLNDMPEAENQFEDSKMTAMKKIETDRITKASIFWSYLTAQQRGLNEDIRKRNYEVIQQMEMADLKNFFNQNIKDKNYTFLVIGNREEVDFDALKKLGRVQELSLEDVFGY